MIKNGGRMDDCDSICQTLIFGAKRASVGFFDPTLNKLSICRYCKPDIVDILLNFQPSKISLWLPDDSCKISSGKS